MNDWVSQALVLKIGHFREIDLWVRLLVPNKGILTAFAFGGAKSRRRFCGCLDVLNTLECHFSRSKRTELYTLTEASLVETPTYLRKNMPRMGLAVNCLRFLESCSVPEENATELFQFMEELRRTLECSTWIATLFPLFFRFSLACRIGYAPDFLRCGLCFSPLFEEQALFVQNEGIVVCQKCAKTIDGAIQFQVFLPKSVRTLLQMVRFTSPCLWSDDSLFPFEKSLCSYAIDGFIQYHLGIAWDRGCFRRV